MFCVCGWVGECVGVCVCMCVRERESECLSVCACMCVRERVCVVWVCIGIRTLVGVGVFVCVLVCVPLVCVCE